MSLKKLNIIYLLFFVIFFIPFEIAAQYSPYFQNYTLSEYNAGNQNWDVSKADNGKLYVANNNGLLEYDGLQWNFKELPNKTIIRSVLAYKDLIYTGSYEEFGYWKKNSKGELIYNSLSDSIKSQISSNEEFWQITHYNGAIVFRSFNNIYIFKNNKIHKIELAYTVLACNVVNNKFYVSTNKNEIYILDNDTLIPTIDRQTLRGIKRIVSVSEVNNSLFITSSLNGCFIYSNKKLSPWKSEINEVIKQQQLNHFSTLKNGNMVFGTIKDGVYLTNSSGQIIFHISKENGLINNTVLGQCIDENEKLWLGLDNGIASVDLSSYNYFFNDVSGKLGAVYDVIKFKGVIYLASNTGLFYLDENNKLQFIEGSQSQIWSLTEIDGELFCCHNYATYVVKNKRLIPIFTAAGGWIIKKVPEHTNTYIEGTYTGLVSFKKTASSWKIKQLGNNMKIRFLVFEDQSTAWAADAYKGLYKIKFDKDFDTITNIENCNKKGVFSEFNVRVYKIKNNICIKTDSGWMKYEPIIDSIVPYDLLNEKFGRDSYLISEEDVDQLVIKNSNNVITFKSLFNNKEEISLPSNYIENRLNVGNENVSKISDSTYALNLINGFMLIDGRTNSKIVLNKPKIEKIEIDKNLISLSNSEVIEFPYKKSISFSLSSAKSTSHYFEYSIQNLDSAHWYKLNREKLELSNLGSGNYNILFRTSNNYGTKSEVTSQKIHILPPWYKNTFGFVLYAFLMLLIAITFYALHKRKVIKEQKLLQLKLKREQREMLREKTLDNEKKIVELKNEALKNEVKLKSKQLANTAMALVKKNEALTELKKELLEHKEGFKNYYSYKKLLKKVDGSIAHHDEWKLFEHNFNQVHEEFFNELKKEHPELTHKDLKICAYIKMNLSTKEIAPLLNISIRGVETSRYRLKRKLNLDNDNSLVAYLLDFK